MVVLGGVLWCARGSQEERERESQRRGAVQRERGSERRGRGGAWRHRGVEEEAGGGRGLSGKRHASPLFFLLAEEEEDKGEEVGWAGQRELGQVSGASKWPR